MSDWTELPEVEAITVGTVGPPGQRVFYLQARTLDRLVTLKLEKQHVAALSTALEEVLADLPPPGPLPVSLELVEPIEAEWSVGSLAMTALDEETGRAMLIAEEAVTEDEAGRRAAFGITREQMAALVHRGNELVEAGRPPCQLCGRPMDPAGHVCPRTNGHLPH
jgi:uncharacterized repeat protein (TIGR03847 family)